MERIKRQIDDTLPNYNNNNKKQKFQNESNILKISI
jgi:hypothetical protein